jgi:hypothetical protein
MSMTRSFRWVADWHPHDGVARSGPRLRPLRPPSIGPLPRSTLAAGKGALEGTTISGPATPAVVTADGDERVTGTGACPHAPTAPYPSTSTARAAPCPAYGPNARTGAATCYNAAWHGNHRLAPPQRDRDDGALARRPRRSGATVMQGDNPLPGLADGPSTARRGGPGDAATPGRSSRDVRRCRDERSAYR